MKHLIVFLIFMAIFASCESQKKSPKETQEIAASLKTPKETVIAYLAATNGFDFKSAKELVILNTKNQQTLETLKKMEKALPDDQKARFLGQEKDALYNEKEITDSTAQIIVTPNQDIALPIEFNLKKVKDNWLIESINELR
jgi:hypothetical protein